MVNGDGSKTKDKKKYMKEYRQKNIDKWYQKICCEDCNIEYKLCNKSHHINSRKHKYMTLLKEKNQQLQQLKDMMLLYKTQSI